MKSRISSKFEELKKSGEKALITFITAGDPGLKETEKLVHALEKAGADIIELGVPFSDPLADGPTIQASHVRALRKNVSVDDVLRLVSRLRKKSEVPIALMISYNLIVRYGLKKFMEDSRRAGVDGIISPDLAVDESSGLTGAANGIDTIFLAAPTSTDERLGTIAEKSSGFIYLISLLGITGERKSLSSAVGENVKRLRAFTDKPIAVGFGVSSPAQAREASRSADGVIVGSAIVKLIEKKASLKSIGKFVSGLKKAANA